MSHFTVTVCLPDTEGMLARACRVATEGWGESGQLLRGAAEAQLAAALAPFDENTEVEPYRSYEDGGPEDYWFTRSVRHGAEKFRQLTQKGPEAMAAEMISREAWLNGRGESIEEKLRENEAEWARDTEIAEKLGPSPSWADVATAYNDRFGEDDEKLLVDEETGRTYTMSTYNERSKWDWYVIGGRWPGRFPYCKGHEGEVLRPEAHWGDPDAVLPPLHCDGGPLRALDLDRMREEAAAEAREAYAKYLAAAAGTPEALPWSVFTDNVSEGGYTIEQAREEYHSQPRIRALSENRDFAFSDNEDFQMPEELYVERARARAVPGWAVLTTDGRWMEQGKMGWWGMNDATEGSSIGYWEAANAYIGSLPEDAWLISVDCHI
jgi:hypothetical protein